MSANSIWEMSQPTIASAGIMSNFNKGQQDQNLLMQQALQNQQIQQQMAQDSLMNPMRLAQAGQAISGEGQRQQLLGSEAEQIEKARITSSLYKGVQALKPFLAKNDIAGAKKAAALFTEYGLPPEVEAEALQMLDSGDIDGINQHIQAIDALAIDPSLKTAGMREFEYMTKGMTPEQIEQARLVDAGLQARAGDSAIERIARTGSTGEVASSQAQIEGAKAGATESAKLNQKLEKEPELEAAKTKAVEAAKLEAKINDKISTAGRDAEGVNSILDIAEKMIPMSTQSGVGTVADAAAGIVGMSTKGAEVADSLKTLEGALIMKMPRMEGPQSNYDVELYRQMAARIGDSNIPAPRRIAALKTLRELTAKYATKTEKPKSRLDELRQKAGL